MLDPISVGGLVALALSTATESIVRGIAEEATKDAYKILKEKLYRLNPADFDALEKSPESVGRQVIVAELVDSQSQEEKEEFRLLAQRLAAAMNKPVSWDDLATSWKAVLVRHEPGSFTIAISLGDEHHRQEYKVHIYTSTIELDGHRIARVSTFGWKTNSINFNIGIHSNQLQLRFKRSWGSASAIELWVDNRLMLRTP